MICCLPQFTFIEYLVNCFFLLSTGLLKYVTVENFDFHIIANSRVFDWTVFKCTFNCDFTDL